MITEEELTALRDRMAANARGCAITGLMETQKPASKPKPRMNKWERAYAAELEQRKHSGEVLWYGFEAIKLRLADSTYYTPDFAAIQWRQSPTDPLVSAAFLEFHEVKGFWRDDARVKIKVAAEMFPFKFVAVTRDRKTGEWKYEHFRGAR